MESRFQEIQLEVLHREGESSHKKGEAGFVGDKNFDVSGDGQKRSTNVLSCSHLWRHVGTLRTAS